MGGDSHPVKMSARCKCMTYKCGGLMVSRDTLRKHADLDYQRLHSMHRAREECALETPRLQTPALPESAYKTSAVFKTPLYDGARITVGEYIFLEFRKFVSHPSFAKRTVSDNFRDDRLQTTKTKLRAIFICNGEINDQGVFGSLGNISCVSQ